MGLFSWNKTIKELLINTKYEKYIEVLDKRNIRTINDFMSYRYSDDGYMRISNLKLQSYLKDCIGDDLYGIIDLVDDYIKNQKPSFIVSVIYIVLFTFGCFILIGLFLWLLSLL